MRLFLLIALVLVGSKLQANSEEKLSRPNVLFIAIDDLNDWLGCLDGHPQALTPNIDEIARRGILFTNAHCASPACNPSRAAVMSGKMSWQTGVWSNKSKKLDSRKENKKMLTLPRAFAAAGYETFGTGKLFHGGTGIGKHFDHVFNTEQRWSPYTKKEVNYSDAELPSKKTDHPRHDIIRDGKTLNTLPLNGMPSDRRPETPAGESFDWGPVDVPDSEMGDTKITDWAIQQLKVKRDKPFFLAVGYYRPHIPLWAHKKYFDRFEGKKIHLPPYLKNDLDDLSKVAKRWAIEPITAGSHATVIKHKQWEEAVKAYLACTTYVDYEIGRLLNILDESDHADNTLIVLWTDHGWHLGEKDHWGKWTGWERSTRVPMMMVPPKGMPEFTQHGKHCKQPVSLIDLYPTLTEICGVQAPKGLDGESLRPLLINPDLQTDRTVITTFDPGNVSLRDTRWRYIHYEDGSEELYDMIKDPNEWENLSKQVEHAATLKRFKKLIPDVALMR